MRRGTERIVRGVVIVVILAALVWFARTVHWNEVWRVMRTTSLPLLIAAIAVNLASLVLKGVRWWIFLRPVGVDSLPLAIRASFTGAALNNILVANSGEAARVILVARTAKVPSERVLATLALERLFELIGYVLLLSFAVSFLPLPPELKKLRPVAIGSLVGVAVLLWYLVKHPGGPELQPEVGGGGWSQRLKRYGKGFLQTMATISTGKRFAASLVISVLVWALQVATYQLTARAAHFDISIVGTIAARLAVNIGFGARATPGNVGVFQMAYAVTAAAFGMDKDQATGVAFLIQIQQILPVTIIGLLASPGILTSWRGSDPASPPPAANSPP